MKIKSFFSFCVFVICAFSFAGCYQVHSDDDLRTVPVTNNPHIIQDSNRASKVPGAAF
jgi:hypothetical protein